MYGEKIETAFVFANGVIRIGKTELQLVAVDSAPVIAGESRFGGIVSAHRSLQRSLARLAMVARSFAPILLEGERGTGKETIARAVHNASDRRKHGFVVACCSELEAIADLAIDPLGTLLFDDLSKLRPSLQLALLEMLDRAGPTSPRLIATTTEPLEPAVTDKRLRADLYYRLAVIRARIPPLVERPEDMPLLARAIAAKYNGAISDDAITLLSRCDFPGNVEELDRVLESAIARAAGEAVRPDHLFADGGEPELRMFHAEKDRVISAFESRYVRALLSRHSGNVSAAAKEAHLARNALYALMKRSGVE